MTNKPKYDFLFTDDEKAIERADMIESHGHKWQMVLHLEASEVWANANEQQFLYCPNCNRITERLINRTDVVDEKFWTMETCVYCNASWFEECEV